MRVFSKEQLATIDAKIDTAVNVERLELSLDLIDSVLCSVALSKLPELMQIRRLLQEHITYLCAQNV